MSIVQTAGRQSQFWQFVHLYWRDAVVLLIPIAVALSHDIHRHFLTTPDGDLPFVASALRMNSGLDQIYTGHTGYVLFLLLSWWFKAMAALGVVPSPTLGGLPPPGNEAFAAAFRDLVFAGRYFIAVGAGAFAVLFYRLCARLTGVQTVAFAAALVFALSRPLGTQALMIYTELPSTFFLLSAFFAISVPGHDRRPLLRVFLIGAFVTLAMMSKMQAIGYVLGMVVLALAFGPDRDEVNWPRPEGPSRWLRNIVALTLIVPAAHMIATSVIWNTIEGASHNGWYHFVILGFTFGAMFLWGQFYRVPVSLRVDSVLMLGAGIAIAWYAHLIRHTMVVTEKLANFLDHLYFMSSMKRFEAHGDVAVDGLVKLGTLLRRAADSTQEVLAGRVALVDPRADAIELLTVPILAGGLWLLYRREKKLAIIVLMLTGFSLGAELFTRLYQFSPKHQIYHAPWLLIAAALLGAYFCRPIDGLWRAAVIAVTCGVLLLTGWGVLLPDMVDKQDIRRAYGEAVGYAPSLADGFKRIVEQHGAVN
ncbi:MAG: hypothetical protein ACFE0S_10285 [Rhodospirillales bacterium]